jgi:hypothetical protein
MVSFGTEQKRPWELPFVHIREVQRGVKTIDVSNPADLGSFHPGDDIWLFSGSFSQSPCPALRGTPGDNCHYSELNTVVKIIPPTTLYLQYPTVNSYRGDGTSAFGIVNLWGNAIHNVGFRNLSITAYGPISTEALIFGFRFENVQVSVGPTTNWWYGGLNRDWVVTDSTLNIGDGGMYFGVENEMDQYADVRFENDTLVGHAAPRGADGLTAYAAVTFDEGSGNVLLKNNRFTGVRVGVDNAFNGFSVLNNLFDEAGLHLGCEPAACGAAIHSFGGSSDVNIIGNRFSIAAPFTPFRVLEVRIPANNVKILNNTIEASSEKLGSVPLLYTAAGVVSGNRIVTNNTKTGYPMGVQIAPRVIKGLPQPDIVVNNNEIEHRAQGNGIQVEDPKTSYLGRVVISNNSIAVRSGSRAVVSKGAASNLKNLQSDIH